MGRGLESMEKSQSQHQRVSVHLTDTSENEKISLKGALSHTLLENNRGHYALLNCIAV